MAACTAVRAIRALQLEVGDSKRPRAGSSRAMWTPPEYPGTAPSLPWVNG